MVGSGVVGSGVVGSGVVGSGVLSPSESESLLELSLLLELSRSSSSKYGICWSKDGLFQPSPNLKLSSSSISLSMKSNSSPSVVGI